MGLKEKTLKWFLNGIIKAAKKKKANLRTKLVLWVLQRTVNKMTGSWKTTATGVCTILVAIAGALSALLDGDPKTSINFEATIAAITAGVGLIVARDNNKSSEDVGAK